jgi:hypothetical protein
MQDDEREFTHPGLRMVHDVHGLRVLLPVKAQRYRKLLHAIWFAIWMVGEALLVASLIGWEALPAPPLPILIPFLAAFSAAGLFVLYRLLWYWAGREKFTVSDGRIEVRRELLGIGRTWVFGRDSVRGIRGQRLEYRVVYPAWGRMFIGHGEGEIVIEGPDGPVAFAKGVEEDEAGALASLLRRELRGPVRDRRPTDLRAAP